MISKELKSQLSILKETNPEYTSEPRRSSIPLPTPQKINKKNT